MKVTQTWAAQGPYLELRTTAEIEGRAYVATYRVDPRQYRFGVPPADLIEREMRRQIMYTIEKELFA